MDADGLLPLVLRLAALLTLLVIVIAGAAESLVANDDFDTTRDGIW